MTHYVYLNTVDATYDTILKKFRFNLPNPITTNNKTMCFRLSEAEVPITYYNVITGFNDTFSFKHTSVNDNNITFTYNITLAEQNYSADELVLALNNAIETQGKVQNSITTTITYNEQTLKFSINCTAATTIIKEIEILESTALRLLGCVVGETTGLHVSDNLTLSMINAANLNRTKNVYIMTDLFGIHTITSSNNSNMSVLAKVQMSLPFGEIVSYQNQNIEYININKQITYIDHINISMLDDDRNVLDFNRINFCLTLIFKDNNEVSNLSKESPTNLISQITF